MNQQSSKKLYVGSLPYKMTEDDLRKLFESIAEITSVRIIIDKFNNQSKGFGFVEMATVEGAKKAIAELNGKEVDGRTLIVNEARPQEQKTRGPGGGGGGPRSFGGGAGGGRDKMGQGGFKRRRFE